MNEEVRILDVKGLNCPMPLLKAKKALNEMDPLEQLKVLATDPGSVRDFDVFTRQSGNSLLDSGELDGSLGLYTRQGIQIWHRKGGRPASDTVSSSQFAMLQRDAADEIKRRQDLGLPTPLAMVVPRLRPARRGIEQFAGAKVMQNAEVPKLIS